MAPVVVTKVITLYQQQKLPNKWIFELWTTMVTCGPHWFLVIDNEYYKHDCQSIQQMKENVVCSSEELYNNYAYLYVCFVLLTLINYCNVMCRQG